MMTELSDLCSGDGSDISSGETEECTLDAILEKRGPFSVYQIFIQTSVTLLILTVSYHNVLSFFTGTNSSWKCTDSNSSRFCQMNHNKTISSDMDTYEERCNMNRSDWMYETPKMFSYVTEFDLICDRTYIGALISASFYIGGVLGCLMSGYTADKFGRKPVLLISSITCAIVSISCISVSLIWQLTVINVIRGASATSAFMCCMLYQSELTIPRLRPIYINILQFTVSSSFLLIDLLAYYVTSWRHLTLYSALPMIPVIIMLCFTPESPRWLLVNGKRIRAEETISKIIGEPNATINIKGSTRRVSEENIMLIHLFNNTTVLKVTAAAMFLMFTTPTVYFSIALNSSNLGGNIYTTYALSTMPDLFACIPATYLSKRIGRKKTSLGGLFISGILLAGLALIPNSLANKYIVSITLTMIARLFCSMAAATNLTWANEVFPTICRSRGFFLCAVSDRFGLVLVPFITRSLKNIRSFLPFVVMSAIAIVGSIVGLLLPETNNKPTRERYEDFFSKNSQKDDKSDEKYAENSDPLVANV